MLLLVTTGECTKTGKQDLIHPTPSIISDDNQSASTLCRKLLMFSGKDSVSIFSALIMDFRAITLDVESSM